ncbi:pistil-specific extensin-like protein [Enhydra lutris kenyoni]|uniref:Pistil-specific extensin-like protein n=1 Tax=Enhydra lutris kenyoni TaxID=391180 RepID=A0A2Y9JQV4_ENHLU|nr:pistil-specific extensin-like protein [Enhydra lutris kenyoni]
MAQDFWKLQKLLFLNGGPKASCDLVSLAACAPNPGVLFFLSVLPLRFAPTLPATVQVPERAGMLPLSTPTAIPSAPTPGLMETSSTLPSPACCPRLHFTSLSRASETLKCFPCRPPRPAPPDFPPACHPQSPPPPPLSTEGAGLSLDHFSSPSVPTQVTSSTFRTLNAT